MLPTKHDRRHRVPTPPPFQRLRHGAFAVLYGPAASQYDRFTRWLFLDEWSHWQQTALSFLPETGLIVELGAGTAALARFASRANRPWIALEPSRSMLRSANRKPLPPSCSLIRATAAALPIRDGTAAAVVATFPGPYIFTQGAAAEARRILQPGGQVVIVLTGRLDPDGIRRRVHRAALDRFYGDPAPSTRSIGQRCAVLLPGFSGRTHDVRTRHGSAQIYVATRAPTAPTA